MAGRGTFLIRTNPKILAALKGWAQDELRSVNAQIEFLLRQSLQQAGRLKEEKENSDDNQEEE